MEAGSAQNLRRVRCYLPAVEILSHEVMEFGKECRIVTDPHSGRGGGGRVEGGGGEGVNGLLERREQV